LWSRSKVAPVATDAASSVFELLHAAYQLGDRRGT
jgi:hypothetical protein